MTDRTPRVDACDDEPDREQPLRRRHHSRRRAPGRRRGRVLLAARRLLRSSPPAGPLVRPHPERRRRGRAGDVAGGDRRDRAVRGPVERQDVDLPDPDEPGPPARRPRRSRRSLLVARPATSEPVVEPDAFLPAGHEWAGHWASHPVELGAAPARTAGSGRDDRRRAPDHRGPGACWPARSSSCATSKAGRRPRSAGCSRSPTATSESCSTAPEHGSDGPSKRISPKRRHHERGDTDGTR